MRLIGVEVRMRATIGVVRPEERVCAAAVVHAGKTRGAHQIGKVMELVVDGGEHVDLVPAACQRGGVREVARSRVRRERRCRGHGDFDGRSRCPPEFRPRLPRADADGADESPDQEQWCALDSIKAAHAGNAASHD